MNNIFKDGYCLVDWDSAQLATPVAANTIYFNLDGQPFKASDKWPVYSVENTCPSCDSIYTGSWTKQGCLNEFHSLEYQEKLRK